MLSSNRRIAYACSKFSHSKRVSSALGLRFPTPGKSHLLPQFRRRQRSGRCSPTSGLRISSYCRRHPSLPRSQKQSPSFEQPRVFTERIGFCVFNKACKSYGLRRTNKNPHSHTKWRVDGILFREKGKGYNKENMVRAGERLRKVEIFVPLSSQMSVLESNEEILNDNGNLA
eukprot:TRINITY_DN15121_c0_g1_i4.p1 TRINITY_DN15121_c0_g1~~TRINITY_DN15121_c0_g1_i4.p1  ORF type:complete len:172 (+),score=17.96 TRINITY_DN15121_c0_g1_i4:243-758(+)